MSKMRNSDRIAMGKILRNFQIEKREGDLGVGSVNVKRDCENVCEFTLLNI
jgi:hypothetical protein